MVTLNDLFADFNWSGETPIGGEPTDYYLRSIKRKNWIITLSYKKWTEDLGSITIQPDTNDLLERMRDTWLRFESIDSIWDVYAAMLDIEEGIDVIKAFQARIGGFKSVSSLLGDN